VDNAIPRQYYGDDIRWFIGVIVNATPPPTLQGRVKVRIHGVHNPSTGEIQESDLPWAQVLIPTTEGGVSGIGAVPGVLPGASVFGYFLDGKSSQLPIIIGSFPRIEFPNAVQQRVNSANQSEDELEYNQEREQNFIESSLMIDDEFQKGNVSRRRSQAIKFFIDNGYRPIHAAALTGVIETVSGFAIYALEAKADKQGLIQWSQSEGNRFKNLVEFAKNYQKTKSWKSYSLQLQYILYELRNTQNRANVKLLQTTSIEKAVEVIDKYYSNSSSNIKDSIQFAERAYDGALE
tara:strand:+ start:3477 stop:4352 length:876 start_codon:yes stop_codon:yes gene_type:complete